MNKFKIFIIITILISFSLNAQSISDIYQAISVEDGLSQNSILELEQDDSGFLWIGTEAGLSRWNGKNIVNYPNNNNDSIPAGFVKALHTDHKGTLWVVPGNGKLYSKNSTSDYFSEAIIDIKAFGRDVIFITSNEVTNSLILITEDNKVYSWDYTLKGLTLIEDFRHKNIKAIHWYNEDLLLGSDRGWLYITKNNEVKSNVNIEWLDNSENPIYDIEIIDNTIYAARDKWGITVHNSNAPDYNNIAIESLYLTSDYNKQLISWNNEENITLIYDLKGFRNTVIKSPNTLEVSDILLLKTGQIAIGSTASGLWMMDPFKPHFISWTHEMPFSKDIVSVIEDENRDLWMATHNGGVIQLNNHEITHKYIDSKDINFLTIDSLDRIWAASNDRGFFVFNKENNQFESPLSNGLKNKTFSTLRINHILEKNENILLISSQKGLYEFNITTKESELKFGNFVWASFVDKQGSAWLCTDDGLFKEMGDQFSKIGSNSAPVWFITEDEDGDIITGSPAGLRIISSTGELYHYEKIEKYLSNKPVYSIRIDKSGYYWITTNSGIIRWERDIDKFDIYTSNDGLVSNEFNLYSITERYNGNLVFGGLKGFNEINPDIISSNPFPTEIIIDKLQKISDSDQVLDRQNDVLSNTDRVIIKPDENIFRVGYQAVEYHDFNNLEVKYQLKGLSESWVDISNENNILFVNLAPKKYILNIIATNITNNSTFTKKINIEVKPFFVETILFKALILIAILIFIIIVFLYVSKLRKEIILRRDAQLKYFKLNRDLEKVLEKRTQELKLSNERYIQQEKMSSLGQLVAGVAHEINTPLGVAVLSNSFIHGIIETLSIKLKAKNLTEKKLITSIEELEQASDQVTYNLDRASNLIRNFKQVAVDKNTDSVVLFNLSNSIQSLLDSLRIKLKHNAVTINFSIEKNFYINSFPSEISQIITNLIMNSINHGFGENFHKKNKVISLKVIQEDLDCIITYNDNGCGISEKYIHKIFDPFFTTNRSFGGTGLGLNIVYNIITEQLNGNIDVASIVGSYTEFHISIPRAVVNVQQ